MNLALFAMKNDVVFFMLLFVLFGLGCAIYEIAYALSRQPRCGCAIYGIAYALIFGIKNAWRYFAESKEMRSARLYSELTEQIAQAEAQKKHLEISRAISAKDLDQQIAQLTAEREKVAQNKS